MERDEENLLDFPLYNEEESLPFLDYVVDEKRGAKLSYFIVSSTMDDDCATDDEMVERSCRAADN